MPLCVDNATTMSFYLSVMNIDLYVLDMIPHHHNDHSRRPHCHDAGAFEDAVMKSLDALKSELSNTIDDHIDELKNAIDSMVTELKNEIDSKLTELKTELDSKIEGSFKTQICNQCHY